MGRGCRHSDSIIVERYDLDGVLNVLAGRVGALRPDEVDEPSYHAGAYNALLTMATHEWRDQVEFFTAFDALLGAPGAAPEGGAE